MQFHLSGREATAETTVVPPLCDRPPEQARKINSVHLEVCHTIVRVASPYCRLQSSFLSYGPEVVPRSLQTSRNSKQDEGDSHVKLRQRDPVCSHISLILIPILLARQDAQRAG